MRFIQHEGQGTIATMHLIVVQCMSTHIHMTPYYRGASVMSPLSGERMPYGRACCQSPWLETSSDGSSAWCKQRKKAEWDAWARARDRTGSTP